MEQFTPTGTTFDYISRIRPLVVPGEADLYVLLNLGQCLQAGAEPRALASIDGYLASESQL